MHRTVLFFFFSSSSFVVYLALFPLLLLLVLPIAVVHGFDRPVVLHAIRLRCSRELCLPLLLRAFAHVELNEQRGKQHKVAAVHAQPHSNCAPVHPAALLREVTVVVGVEHHHRADHHLQQLRTRDERGDGANHLTQTQRTHEIVEVHNGVHGVIHAGKPEPTRNERHAGVPAEYRDSEVVVPVQEDDRLLGQDKENGVDHLWNLAQQEGHEPKGQLAVVDDVFVEAACRLVHTTILKQVEEQRADAEGAADREEGERQVPGDD